MFRRLLRGFSSTRRIGTQSLSKADPPLRCTVFNEKGQVTQVAASIDRKTFIRQYGLHSRDLRHIDGQQAGLVPYILVHRGTLLVNICDLRVIIRRDEVLVFHSRNPAVAERLSMLVYEFTAKLGSTSSQPRDLFHDKRQTYEQTALETVLLQAISYLEVEQGIMLDGLNRILTELEAQVDRELLKDLLVRSKELQRFHRKTLAVRNVLDNAIDDVPNFQYMSEGASAARAQHDYNDIEILLETYYREADELVQKSGRTVRDVSTTEEIINIMIDANRNSLLLLRLEISVLTVGFTISIFLAGLYGMNLENFIQDSDWGMLVVSGSVVLLCVASTVYNFRRLRRTEKVFVPSHSRVPHQDLQPMNRWLQTARHTPNVRLRPPR